MIKKRSSSFVAAVLATLLGTQGAFAESPHTSAATVDSATVDAVLADEPLMDRLNAENGPAVECMIGALANVYRPIYTAEQTKVLAAHIQEAGKQCGVRAQAARTVTLIQAKLANLSTVQALQVAEGVITGQALIGAALEYGKSHRP